MVMHILNIAIKLDANDKRTNNALSYCPNFEHGSPDSQLQDVSAKTFNYKKCFFLTLEIYVLRLVVGLSFTRSRDL